MAKTLSIAEKARRRTDAALRAKAIDDERQQLETLARNERNEKAREKRWRDEELPRIFKEIQKVADNGGSVLELEMKASPHDVATLEAEGLRVEVGFHPRKLQSCARIDPDDLVDLLTIRW